MNSPPNYSLAGNAAEGGQGSGGETKKGEIMTATDFNRVDAKIRKMEKSRGLAVMLDTDEARELYTLALSVETLESRIFHLENALDGVKAELKDVTLHGI